MEAKIIKASAIPEEDFGRMRATTILNTPEWPNFSVARVVRVEDDVREGYETESDLVYYVLEGEGIVVVNGVEHHVAAGDCLAYPHGTKYKHMKGMTLLAIASPRFDREKHKYVE